MKKLLILLTVLLVLGSSCKKDFLNVNETNPNSASAVPPNLVLPAALNTTARIITNPDNFTFIYLWYGEWSISGGYAQPTNLTQYNLLNSSYQGIWSGLYQNLANYDYIEKNSTTPQSSPYKAISMIMKAYIFQTLVDCYGNVPYSEALKGSAKNQILKPKYDNQQDIYDSLVVKLDDAMSIINNLPADAAEVGSYDIVYNGDMGAWVKFANTLKLRMLVNQSGITSRGPYIASAISSSSTPADFIGAGEGALANPGYLNSANKMNPFWENYYKVDGSAQADGITYTMAGQDAVDFLNDNNDPRRLLIFAPYSGTNIKGNYFGALLLGTVPTTSPLGSGMLKGPTQSAPLLTDFESLFIQAEAALKGIITGDPKSLYTSGVTESIVYFGGNAADATEYLTQGGKPLVNYDEAPNKLEVIITQKWISLNGVDPMPVWTDYRRTHFPRFIHFSQDPAKLNATPPVRLLYPQTELNVNPDNANAQGPIDLFDTHIFWDPFQK